MSTAETLASSPWSRSWWRWRWRRRERGRDDDHRIKTGTDVITAALYARNARLNLGPLAREIGVSADLLEQFLAGRVTLLRHLRSASEQASSRRYWPPATCRPCSTIWRGSCSPATRCMTRPSTGSGRRCDRSRDPWASGQRPGLRHRAGILWPAPAGGPAQAEPPLTKPGWAS